MSKKLAACVIVHRGHDSLREVAAASRKNDRTKFGFLGGKPEPVDRGYLTETGKREALEEGGFIVADLREIYTGSSGGEYVTTAFLAQTWLNSPKPRKEQDIEIRWMKPEVLCDPEISPWPDYNRKVFEALGWLRKT